MRNKVQRKQKGVIRSQGKDTKSAASNALPCPHTNRHNKIKTTHITAK